MNEELTSFIVDELVKYHDRKEILREVREKSGLNCRAAEQLLILVEAQHKRTIAARQSPLLFLLSVAILFLGLTLLAFNVDILQLFFQHDIVDQVLRAQSTVYGIIGWSTGLSMSTGGVIGLWKGLRTVFPD
jgi:hypothetical protein